MNKPRYLTKSRFKLALECPTKLYYTKKDQYKDVKLNDTFLAALAKGGYQVGELAKCYFPGGINIDELDYEIPLMRTTELLAQENVVIYEAAFLYENLFIRADVIVKNGNRIRLYEVKAKSAKGEDEPMTLKNGMPNSEWKSYLYDIAFQKHVVSCAFPDYEVFAYLMVADKSKLSTVDGLNQKFLIGKDEDGRTKIDIIGNIDVESLGNQILCAIPVDSIINRIYSEEVFHKETGTSFKDYISLCAEHYANDRLLAGIPNSGCSKCEFKTTEQEENSGFLSGYKECWSSHYGFKVEDFVKPSILDIWNYRGKDKLISEGRFFQSQVKAEDLAPKTKSKSPVSPGMSNYDRQLLQIIKSNEGDSSVYFDSEGIKDVMGTFNFPLHFIDFETTAVAIPFHKGLRPYEQVAFQFSHHVVYENGSIEHHGEWINTSPGKFPNFEFVRQLKGQLEHDEGTIFRYAAHENSILNAIFRQLRISDEPDKDSLCNWIKTITKSTSDSPENWEGPRNMVDLLELIKRYYYAPRTNGSNSIKYVLPALLNSSEYLKNKYSKPIYGNEIPSLNFRDHIWIAFDEQGTVNNPYNMLKPVFSNIDNDVLDEMLTGEEGEIRDGGAAMLAYAQMQFSRMDSVERDLITKSLLRYCELDTLAMVMIWEDWNNRIKNQ